MAVSANLEIRFVGVPMKGALFGVCIRTTDFGKFPYLPGRGDLRP